MRPKLSIVLITYNHGKYIREALDGILMQKVNFAYEIVVGDDCSTDDTCDILKEYASKNPGLSYIAREESWQTYIKCISDINGVSGRLYCIS